MTIQLNTTSLVSPTSHTFSLSTMLSITSDPSNPTYLYVVADDNNVYTVGATGATGYFTGNGVVDSLAVNPNNGLPTVREAGIQFIYNAPTGQYTNATYGNINNVTFTTSGSQGDITDIGVYATNSTTGTSYLASETYDLSYYTEYGYLGATTAVHKGDVTLLTSNATPAAVTPEQNATPSSIASIAQAQVGLTCDDNGCWVLASTISALAGASLPFTSLFTQAPGLGSGEWFVAYTGTSTTDTAFQNDLRTGDVVTFVTTAGNGHVTTVVAGSGANAWLIDNASFGYNKISGTDDLVIQPEYAQYRILNGVNYQSVNIYRLDAPTVVAASATVGLDAGNTLTVGSTFSATDPKGTAITKYEIRTGNAGDVVARNGVALVAVNGTYSVASMDGVQLLAQSVGGTHSIGVRAYNGAYWGDWADSAVTTNGSGNITAPITAPTAIVSGIQISNDTGASSSDFVTNAANQTVTAFLTGALGANDRLMGSVDGGADWTDITADVTGVAVSWNTTLSGTSSIQLKVSNAAGSTPTATQAYVLDTTPPAAPAGIAISADTGPSSTDFVTNVATQTITATLAAPLARGDRVLGTIDGGTPVDLTAFVTGTTVTWAGAVLHAGMGSIRLLVVDLAGNQGATGGHTYSLDVTPPTVGQPTLAAGSDSGTAGDGITNVTTPTLTGTAEAGTTVAIYDGATLVGTTTADGTGHYSVSTSHLADGIHALTAQASDRAGNVATSAPTLVTIDATAPTVGAPTLSIASDSGIVGDGLTNDVVPVVIGIASPGSQITLYDTDGTTVLGTAPADAGGAYSIASQALADGAHALTARATDAAGNQSQTSQALALTIDATPPAASAPLLSAGSDSGIAGDGVTNVATPTVTGTVTEGNCLVTLYDTDGTTVVGTAISDQSGGYAITTATLSDGTHLLTARAIDAAGNDGAASGPLAVTIDTSTPQGFAGIAIEDGTGSLNGVLGTAPGAVVITASLDAPLGAGEVALGSMNGGRTWTDVTSSISGTDLRWSTTAPNGPSTIKLEVVDLAGTTGAVATQAVYAISPGVITLIPDPVVTTPVVTTPVTTDPVDTTPVTTDPVVTTPISTDPVVADPIVTTPVVTTPVVTVPVVTTPVVMDPVVTDPVVTDPVVTTPVVTDPVVTNPVTTTPVDITPVDTTPVVTTPIVTTPVVTEPVVTTPVVTDPAKTGLTISQPTQAQEPDPATTTTTTTPEAPALQQPNETTSQPSPTAVPRAADDAGLTFRFFDSTHGTQFMTSSISERDTLIASRPDLTYEGKGMGTVQADPDDKNVSAVFRFFSKVDGTHFFTTSATEKDQTIATRSDLTFEGSSFNEHLTAQAGDVAVYRFFNATNGSHFFTSSDTERTSLAATRPDMVNEGIAFYAPQV